MDLSLSEEQSMLQDVTRRLCSDFAPLSVLRDLEGTEPGYCEDFWRQLCELGLTGLAIEENYGGLGLGSLDAVVVNEEFGRSLTISPHNMSSVLAASLINALGNENQKDRWLSSIASGERIVTVASSEPGSSFNKQGIRTVASLKNGAYTLSGSKHFVPFATSADGIIVLAQLEHDAEKVVALMVEIDDFQSASNVELNYLSNHAQEPLYSFVLDGLVVPEDNVLAGGECVWEQWETSMSDVIIPLAGFAVGGAQQVHDLTVEYAKYRHAFGRAIGGFQSIAHYLADVTVAIEGARTLVYQAAWAKDQGLPYQKLAAMAKLQACDTFCQAASVAIQVHGGMGYTMEADPQLFFRRAKQLQTLHWDSGFLEKKIAGSLFS